MHKAGANKQAHPAGNGKEWNSSREVAHEGEGFENTIPHGPDLARGKKSPFTNLAGS